MNEELINQYRYLVGGYYGVELMDEYPLKEYMLNDIIEYINNFVEVNPIDNFNYEEEFKNIGDTVTNKVKLQDALLVLNKMNAPMDLVFLVKKRLKKYKFEFP